MSSKIKYSCKDYVKTVKDNLKNEIAALDKQPTLVVIQVDDDPASTSYIKGKKKDCEEVGIKLIHIKVDSNNCSQRELCELIEEFDYDFTVHGIIIQLPIPEKYNVEELQKCISPEKDVDGFRVDSNHKPCTPKGIIDWLKHNNYDFVGKDCVVIGRSKIVGKPLVNMLIDEGATVTCCNSHTSLFAKLRLLKNADAVFSAIGKPKYFKCDDFVKPVIGNDLEVIVDVGINRDENGKLCGDIDNTDFEKVFPETYVTPVPGSVGLLTRVTLLTNTMDAYHMLEVV